MRGNKGEYFFSFRGREECLVAAEEDNNNTPGYIYIYFFFGELDKKERSNLAKERGKAERK